MVIHTRICYPEQLLSSSQSRKARTRQAVEYVDLQLREAKPEELTPAFDMDGTTIFSYNDRLYIKANPRDINAAAQSYEHPYLTLERIFQNGAHFKTQDKGCPNARVRMLMTANTMLSKYLLVDEAGGSKFMPDWTLYREVIEPRYCVVDYGAIGGVDVVTIADEGDRNLPMERYFSALDGDWAYDYADKLAKKNGCKNFSTETNAHITVLKEDEVCWPRRDQSGNLREFYPA